MRKHLQILILLLIPDPTQVNKYTHLAPFYPLIDFGVWDLPSLYFAEKCSVYSLAIQTDLLGPFHSES